MSQKADKGPAAKKCKYQLIKNNINRNNTKCKRKSNLFKKSMQLSKLCGQDILLIIYDEEFQKIYQYRSNEKFDINKAKEILDQGLPRNGDNQNKRRSKQPVIKVFDYSNKDIKKFAKGDDEFDDNEEVQDEEEKEEKEEEQEQIVIDKQQTFSLGTKRIHSEIESQTQIPPVQAKTEQKKQKKEKDANNKQKQVSKKIMFFPEGQQSNPQIQQIANGQQQPAIEENIPMFNAQKQIQQNQQSELTKSLCDSSKKEDHKVQIGDPKIAIETQVVKNPQDSNDIKSGLLPPNQQNQQQFHISFVRSTSKDSNKRLDGVNTANSRILDTSNANQIELQGIKSCSNVIQNRQKLSLNQKGMNFGANLVIQTKQSTNNNNNNNANNNFQKQNSMSISDFTKPVAGGQSGLYQGYTSPLQIQKNIQKFDWQKSNIKMSEPSSISIIKPQQVNDSIYHNFAIAKNLQIQKLGHHLNGNDETPASISPVPPLQTHQLLQRGLNIAKTPGLNLLGQQSQQLGMNSSQDNFNFSPNINIIKPSQIMMNQQASGTITSKANIRKQLDDTRRYLRTQAFKPQLNSTNSRIMDNRRNELIREFGKSSQDFRQQMMPAQPEHQNAAQQRLSQFVQTKFPDNKFIS